MTHYHHHHHAFHDPYMHPMEELNLVSHKPGYDMRVPLRPPPRPRPCYGRTSNPEMMARQYAEEEAAYIIRERAKNKVDDEDAIWDTLERKEDMQPLGKAKTFMQGFNIHTKIVEHLIEEPMFAEAEVGEPVLEVKIVGGELHGPWPHPFLNNLWQPFVRHYIDNEMVGQTKPWREDADPRRPQWNSRQLVFPRGARCSQFEVLNNTSQPLVLGDCAYNLETIWKCTKKCGKFTLTSPILYRGYQVGTLQVRYGPWDGLPLDEDEFSTLPELEGTLAGALDNPFMREFGPEGYRNSEGNPFAVKPFMTNFMPNPMANWSQDGPRTASYT